MAIKLLQRINYTVFLQFEKQNDRQYFISKSSETYLIVNYRYASFLKKNSDETHSELIEWVFDKSSVKRIALMLPLDVFVLLVDIVEKYDCCYD